MSFHHPKSYADVTKVVASGHYFHTTPHGLRGEAVHQYVAATDESRDLEVTHLFGHRDDFTADALEEIRSQCARAVSLYVNDHSRLNKRINDIAYIVSLDGQLLGFIRRDKSVEMNPDILKQATPATRRKYVTVQQALEALAETKSWHFDLESI